MAADIALEDAGETSAVDADSGALGWTVVVIAVMTVLLALFNAASIKSWAETLPPTPRNLAIHDAAENWYDLTERLGLAAPRASLRAVWTSAHAWRFGAPRSAESSHR
jgi:hypothetical protein